jgi:serine/threonine protein kinase
MNREAEILFHEVADLSPEQRESYFRTANVPPSVRHEVEVLLHFDTSGAKPLTESVAECAEQLLDRVRDAKPPEHCGPYRLARMLGRGGMGSVYLADRDDGEVKQRAAIKFLRYSGEDAAFRDRFLQERQILATLNHPGIARLIDAGHTEDGQLYLVMEYVEGEPIDVYAAKLDLRDTLKLFVQVCDAVSHAHRNLIVHRDLKPSNILVKADGHPKLLDFGIAKILEAGASQTQTRESLLTPDYASPEQQRGAAHTTATDVYSLGAVLYKLLTGSSPNSATTQAKSAATSVAGTKLAQRPSRVNPKVPRDLDFIVGKSLRQEPEERYSTVEALADDLRAFLESRPVRARAGDRWYRVRKFARLYWVPVAATAVVIASLAAGLYIANRERVIAQRRFQQLRQLSNQVFDLDNSIRNLPGSAPSRQRLVTASLQYLEGLRVDSHGDLDLAGEMADAYWRVARVQGVPVELNLGQTENAQKSLQKADALNETVLAGRPANRAALLRSAVIAGDRMILAQEGGQPDAAIGFARKAEQRLDLFMNRTHAAQIHATEDDIDTVALTYGHVAQAYRNLHLKEDSLRNARRSVEIARGLTSPQSIRLPASLSLLAIALREQGDLDGALAAILESRKLAEQATYATETQRMINMYAVLTRQAAILANQDGVSLDRPADAIEPLQKALDLTEEATRKNPADFASRSRLATAARDLGAILQNSQPQRSLDVYDLGARQLAEFSRNPQARRSHALLLANSSYPLRALHRLPEAKQRIDEAFALLAESGDYPADRIKLDSAASDALHAQADYLADAGDVRGAIRTYEQLLQETAESGAEAPADLWTAVNLSRIYRPLAALYSRAGEPGKARQMEDWRLQLWNGWNRKLPNNAFVLRQVAAQ